MRKGAYIVLLFSLNTFSVFPQGNELVLDSNLYEINSYDFDSMSCTYYRSLKLNSQVEECRYKNGAIKRRSFYYEGHLNGTRTKWYQSGQIHQITTYVDDCPYGTFYEWYDNGKIKEVGSYGLKKDRQTLTLNESYVDTLVQSNDKQDIVVMMVPCRPQKHGIWLYFDNKGEILKRESYDYGTLLKTK